MFKTFQIPISWGELFKRTMREFSADKCLGLAAQLAYYTLLALVPAIAFVLALTSFLPSDTIQRVISGASAFIPADVLDIIRSQLSNIASGQHGGIAIFGLLLALWSSSAAIVAVTDALNQAYDIEEGRPWWKVRLTAILLTLGLAVFVVAAFGLVLLGPTVADWLGAHMGFGAAFVWTWKIVQWPLAFVLIALAIALLNYFAPDADQDWTWITPGAVLATALWLLASLAFKIYVTTFADYNETYGPLGGVVVLMLWFYISAVAVLAGAEMNAEIEHASPYGKAAGEKVPGEKKKLGTRAAQAWAEKHKGGQPQRPAVRPAAIPPRAFEPEGAPSRWLAVPVFVAIWFRRRKTRT